jgi:hypothetical protein
MFLRLQLDHPNILLIPSADILFVQFAHVLRTNIFHEDVKRLALNISDWDLFALQKEDERFFNEAVRATASIWQKTFKEPFPKGQVHAFFRHDQTAGAFSSISASAHYIRPSSYVGALFSGAPPKSVSALPEVSLSAHDVEREIFELVPFFFSPHEVGS